MLDRKKNTNKSGVRTRKRKSKPPNRYAPSKRSRNTDFPFSLSHSLFQRLCWTLSSTRCRKSDSHVCFALRELPKKHPNPKKSDQLSNTSSSAFQSQPSPLWDAEWFARSLL